MTAYDVKAGWTDDRTVTQPQPIDHSMIREKKPKAGSCSLGVFECLTAFRAVRYCNLLCGHFCNLELLNLTHYFSLKWISYVKKRNWHLIFGNNRKLYSKQSQKHQVRVGVIRFSGFTFHNGKGGTSWWVYAQTYVLVLISFYAVLLYIDLLMECFQIMFWTSLCVT